MGRFYGLFEKLKKLREGTKETVKLVAEGDGANALAQWCEVVTVKSSSTEVSLGSTPAVDDDDLLWDDEPLAVPTPSSVGGSGVEIEVDSSPVTSAPTPVYGGSFELDL